MLNLIKVSLFSIALLIVIVKTLTYRKDGKLNKWGEAFKLKLCFICLCMFIKFPKFGHVLTAHPV